MTNSVPSFVVLWHFCHASLSCASVLSHLNNDDQILFDKISQRLGTDSKQIRELLIDEDNAILGKNKLIHKFGMDGIKWNPKDDALVKIQIFPKYSDSKQVTFSGKLYSVKTKS